MFVTVASYFHILLQQIMANISLPETTATVSFPVQATIMTSF